MINELINELNDFIKNNIKVNKIDENTYEIETPFLDKHNDNIVVIVKIENDKIKLINEDIPYDLYDISFKTFLKITYSFNVLFDSSTGFLYMNVSNFGEDFFKFIQCLIVLGHYHYYPY